MCMGMPILPPDKIEGKCPNQDVVGNSPADVIPDSVDNPIEEDYPDKSRQFLKGTI